MNIKNVLIVSAHPDDYELGMGMRIKKYTSAGVRVTAITATVGEYKDSPRGRIKQEKEAGRILGIQEQINLELPCSRLSEFSIDFRNRVEKIVNDIKPDIAYTIYPNDLHVDHEVVSIHSLVAFRSVKNVVYYRVAYSRGFSPNLFFFGNKKLLEFKIKSLKCFKEEIRKSGTIDLKRVSSLAKYEFHNHLHHRCTDSVRKSLELGETVDLLFEPFYIERLISF